jgi:feruloyl-CoA synthase
VTSSLVDTAMQWLGPDSVGKYLFTSGSTGMPKPAPQSQGQMTAQIAARRGDREPSRSGSEEVPQNARLDAVEPYLRRQCELQQCARRWAGHSTSTKGRPMPGLFQTTIEER